MSRKKPVKTFNNYIDARIHAGAYYYNKREYKVVNWGGDKTFAILFLDTKKPLREEWIEKNY